MNNVKSAPDIGPKPVSKHAVVQNAMDMVCSKANRELEVITI